MSGVGVAGGGGGLTCRGGMAREHTNNSRDSDGRSATQPAATSTQQHHQHRSHHRQHHHRRQQQRFHPARNVPVGDALVAGPPVAWWPSHLNAARRAGDLAIVSWNLRSKGLDELQPYLEALIRFGHRPVICAQEVLGLSNQHSTYLRNAIVPPTGPGPAAPVEAFLRHHFYLSYFSFNAVTATGQPFTGTRGAALFIPIEYSPRQDFAGSNVLVGQHRQTDVAAAELANFRTRVIAAYCHPTGLRTDDIIDVIVRNMPPNSIVGADFNRELRASEQSTADEQHQLSLIADACSDNRTIIIAPDSPTTAKRHIDGFFMKDNTGRVPLCGDATVISFTNGSNTSSSESLVSDHKPVMMGIRGAHKTYTTLQPSVFATRKFKPRHLRNLNDTVLRLVSANPQREPHETLLEAANKTLPKTPRRWKRCGTERDPAYREKLLRVIRTNDLSTAIDITVPRRQPQNVQPLTDGTNVLASNEEKAKAFGNFIVNVLHNNTANIAPRFEQHVVDSAAERNPELTIAEAMFAQRRMSSKAARDKHGIPPAVVMALSSEALRLLCAHAFHEATRGRFSDAIKSPRVSGIEKPNKPSRKIADLRPITVIDQILSVIDRVQTRRGQISSTMESGIIAPSQTAVMRGVPCSLQVLAVMQHAANMAADGAKTFFIGNPPEAVAKRPDGAVHYRTVGAAINMLAPREIRNQLLDHRARYRPYLITRVEATRLLLVDQTSAYPRVSLTGLMNRLHEHPCMQQYMAYVHGINANRTFYVVMGSHRSDPFVTREGLGQGLPGSGFYFCISSEPVSRCLSMTMDFNTEFIDDSNGACWGRCPVERDGRAQRGLNCLSKTLDELGLQSSADKCKALLITHGGKGHKHIAGLDHFVIQKAPMPLVNPAAHSRVPPRTDDRDDNLRERAKTCEQRAARHLGVFLDQQLSMIDHCTIILTRAKLALNSLVPYKYRLPSEILFQLVHVKALSPLKYACEGFYPRLSAAARRPFEKFVRQCALLITGCCKNTSNKYVIATAGLTSYRNIVERCIVTLDEKCIRMSTDFDPSTGVYQETPYTRQHMSQPNVSTVPNMAKLLTSPWHGADGERVNPREHMSLHSHAAALDMNAHKADGVFSRAEMLREPVYLGPVTGRPLYPFASFDPRRLRFELAPPGGLTRSSATGDAMLAACYKKLNRDAQLFGPYDYEAYTDGGADLQHYGGSAAAFAIWDPQQPECVYDPATDTTITSPPRWKAVGPAGAAACSYSAEGRAVVYLLRRFLDLARKSLLRKTSQHERMRIRIVLDGKSFPDALVKGALMQREYLEVCAYEELTELQLAHQIDFAFIFVFGHVGVRRNIYVDTMCTKFMKFTKEDPDPETGLYPLSPVPMRLCDSVNVRLRDVHPLLERTPDPFERKDQYGRPMLLLPQKPCHDLGLPRENEIRLYRLRALCAPSIGNVLKNQLPSKCRQCDEPVMMRENAVRHMFACESETAVAARGNLTLQDVPDDRKARRILAYMTLFEEQAAAAASSAGPAAESGSDSDSDAGSDAQWIVTGRETWNARRPRAALRSVASSTTSSSTRGNTRSNSPDGSGSDRP